MFNRNALIFGFISAAIVGALLVYFFRTAPDAPPVNEPVAVEAPAPFVGPRTKAQAMNDLMALPELKAWSEHLTTSSGGVNHGALIEYGPTPKTIGDKKYWQLSYVENTPDAAHRWESFLVGENTPEILVEEDESAEPITLEEWRQTKKPLERKSAQ